MYAYRRRGIAFLILLSAIVGIVAGVLNAVYGVVFERLAVIGKYLVLHGFVFLPAIGFACSAYFLTKVFGFPKGSSTEHFIEVYHRRYGRLEFKEFIAYTVLALVTVFALGSVGPEGPALVLGGYVGYVIARLARLSLQEVKYFTLIGAAAGVAAVFRAPLTALTFALEVPYMADIESGVFLETLVASIVAFVVAVIIAGPQKLLLLTPFNRIPVPSLNDVLLGFIIGLLGAFLAQLMVGTKHVLKHFMHRVVERLGEKGAVLVAAVFGLFVGYLTIIFPAATGPGTEETLEILAALKHGEPVDPIAAAAMGISRLFLTPASLALGGTGGVFFPHVAIGVQLGYAIGWYFHLPARYMSTVMAALAASLFAGTNKVLVSAVLFGLEVVGFGAIVPSVIAATISYVVTLGLSLHGPQILYRAHGKMQALLELVDKLRKYEGLLEIPADEVANRNVVAFKCDELTGDVIDKIRASGQIYTAYPVVDDYRSMRLLGYVELEDVLGASEVVKLCDIMRPAPAVLKDTPLKDVIHFMVRYEIERVFVIDEDYTLIGIITKTDILRTVMHLIHPVRLETVLG